MSKKIIICAISLLALAACNNSSKESENKKDSTAMNNDSMNQMNMSSTDIPPVPPIPDGAKVFFKSPKDGATVTSPFKVEMGVENIKVDTAGPVIAGVGHHHLMIDDGDSLAVGAMVAKDSTHIHYGKGQTETELNLPPGKHKLTLQFADGLHRSYGGKLSATINVNVKK